LEGEINFLPPIDIRDSATFEGVSGALLIRQSRDGFAFYLRISVRHEDSRNCFSFCRRRRLEKGYLIQKEAFTALCVSRWIRTLRVQSFEIPNRGVCKKTLSV
jgi:hypothetical protein